MVICRLKGGLGNQLFQWAFARNISNLYSEDLYFDINFLINTPTGVTKRNFSLNKFPNLKGECPDFLKPNKELKIIDDSIKYSDFLYDVSYDYVLDGYFQDYKYFETSNDVIKGELRPTLGFYESSKYAHLIEQDLTSIHIRRTDYIKSNGYHPVQSLDYYKNALEIIGKYDHLLVFSDDIDWCVRNLNFDNMLFVSNNDEVFDLHLMSMCKNNIIANSSFSWWAAYLNENKGKKIIMPKRWFADHVDYDPNNSPKDWIRI